MNQHTDMSRNGPLKNLRRRQLETLAKKHGVPVSHDDPAWLMQKALEAKDIRPDAPAPVEDSPDLEDLSLFQLRKVCKEREIPYQKTDKKVDLLMKLGV